MHVAMLRFIMEICIHLQGIHMVDLCLLLLSDISLLKFTILHTSESVTNPIWILCTQIFDSLYPIWAQYFDNGIIK